MPTCEEALELLNWAGKLNPGNWIQHSQNVARAAQTIAANCNLDPKFAYCLGLLHDIGRYNGINHMKHIVLGYNLMLKYEYYDIAKICITHSFPIANVKLFSGQNDCSAEDIAFIQSYLNSIEYDDYDKLIQLCDALGDAKGVTIIETRLMDVARRRGINDMTITKWNAFFNLKDYFSEKCGKSIYSLFYSEICNSIIL